MGDLGEAYELRARLRPLAVTARVRDCGRRPITDAPELVVRDYGENEKRRAWWTGLLRCGRQHACPVCAARVAADRAEELDRMMKGAGGRWQMVTLTLKHHRGESLQTLLDALLKAWRLVRRQRLMRDIFDARVTATVRAVEATGGWDEGGNGWHPHIHLLLRTSEWSERDRAVLEWLWAKTLGERAGWAGIAVHWSTPIESWQSNRARYLSKLGAEVAGIGKRAWGTHHGRLGPWQIAEAALYRPEREDEPPMTHEERERCDFFRSKWEEYQRALRGRRLLELDERAKAFAVEAEVALEVKKEWTLTFHREEFQALAAFERVEPRALWFLVEAALTAGPDPPGIVRSYVDDWLAWKAPLARAGPRPVRAETPAAGVQAA